MMQSDSTRSSRREYLEWIEEQLENFKDSIPRSDLLRIADEAVRELPVTGQGQYQLTEVLLSDAVDRRLARLLKLPTYRSWRTARRKGRIPPPGPAASHETGPDVSDRHIDWPPSDTPDERPDPEE